MLEGTALEGVPAALAVAANLVTIVGLILVWYQIREMKSSVESGAVSAIYAHGGEVRQALVDHPEIRQYLFDETIAIGKEHEHYARTRTIAEMQLNYLEHLAVQNRNFGKVNWDAWQDYVVETLRYPFIRQVLAEREACYAMELRELAGAD